MQICRPFHYSANAADSTVRKTHRLIEMRPAKSARLTNGTDRGREAEKCSDKFGHSDCVFLREYVNLPKWAVCPLRCMIAQNYAEITRTHEVSKSGWWLGETLRSANAAARSTAHWRAAAAPGSAAA